MAGELQVTHTTGQTVYAMIFNATSSVWDAADTAFEAYATAQLANYDIGLGELGTASQIYSGTFPAAITTPGSYWVIYRVQAGGAPAETDTIITSERLEWNGTARIARAAWAHISVFEVPEARTWIVEADGRVSGTKIVSTIESGTFCMDFSMMLDDNETSFVSADSVTDISGNALAVTNLRLSGDKLKVYFDVAAIAWTAATTYTLRVAGTATDGNKYSADGTLKTRA